MYTLGHLEAIEKGIEMKERMMIGKQVMFKAPSLNGKMTLAGIVKRILPDGRMEVKSQNHGYWTLKPSEVFYDHEANKS